MSAAQLIAFARRWCYEHKLLIPGERTLHDLVRTAIPQAKQELFNAIEKAIPEVQRSQWLDALGSMRSQKRSVLDWLQGEPGKLSRHTLAEQMAYVDFLKGLAVHRYPLERVRLEHQKQSVPPVSKGSIFEGSLGMVQFAGSQGNTSQGLLQTFRIVVQWVTSGIRNRSVTLI